MFFVESPTNCLAVYFFFLIFLTFILIYVRKAIIIWNAMFFVVFQKYQRWSLPPRLLIRGTGFRWCFRVSNPNLAPFEIGVLEWEHTSEEKASFLETPQMCATLAVISVQWCAKLMRLLIVTPLQSPVHSCQHKREMHLSRPLTKADRFPLVLRVSTMSSTTWNRLQCGGTVNKPQNTLPQESRRWQQRVVAHASVEEQTDRKSNWIQRTNNKN